MKLLCVSDIHGNLDALRAVMAVAERDRVDKLLVAGDIVFPTPNMVASGVATDPLETWRRLLSAGALMVRGPSDTALSTVDPDDLNPHAPEDIARVDLLRETQEVFGEMGLHKLRKLPLSESFRLEDGGELLLVHGSPADASEPLSHDMTDEELDSWLHDTTAAVVVCGCSHVPFDRMVEGVRIINVGSVGDAPDERNALTDPPVVAHATWIESGPLGITVEQRAIPLGVMATALAPASASHAPKLP